MRKGYAVDAEFFSRIDSQEKAYFLGLLYADGTIYSSKGNYKVSLVMKDRDIVWSFRKYLGSEAPVKEYKKGLYEVHICNKKIVEDLVALGCTPRKAKTITLPSLSSRFVSHFVRGYFDGDGSVGFRKTGNSFVSIAGNETFILQLGRVIYDNTGVTPHVYPNDKTCQLIIRAWDGVVDVLDWFYTEARVFLNRKYNIYQEVLYRYENYKQYREDSRGIHFSKEFLVEMYKKYKTWTKVAEVIGYSYDHLKVYRRSLGLTNYKG